MFLCFLQVGRKPIALRGTTDNTNIVSTVPLMNGAKAGINKMMIGKLRQWIIHAEDIRMLSLENIPGCEICILKTFCA